MRDVDEHFVPARFAGMSDDRTLDVLIAQLQIRMERLQSLLVTCSRREANAVVAAQRVVSGLRAREIETALCIPATFTGTDDVKRETLHPSVGADTAVRTFTPAQAGAPHLARALLTVPGTITVVAAPGVLEDPVALFLAAAADGVLLVVAPGQTTRADLRRARLEIETAGGHLVGAVLHR